MAATLVHAPRGLHVRVPDSTDPEKTLELYEFESCPYCRKVRDTLSEMDLNYLCHPCARGSRNRLVVMELGGKQQFPFLVDPNTGRQMYESEDIITYLAETYGSGRSAMSQALSPLNTASSMLASAVRPRGGRVTEGVSGASAGSGPARPEKVLELYSFEGSPYCRKVREALNMLDLTFLVHNVAKGSRRRPELVARGGKMMVPYLIDPNTGVEMYESDDIVAYLRKTYGG
jgi:glutathione S-transferase